MYTRSVNRLLCSHADGKPIFEFFFAQNSVLPSLIRQSLMIKKYNFVFLTYMTPDIWHMTHDTWHDTWHMTPDKWHATHYIWHMTPDTWHMIYDTWHMTHDTWHMTHDICLKLGSLCDSLFITTFIQMNSDRESSWYRRRSNTKINI